MYWFNNPKYIVIAYCEKSLFLYVCKAFNLLDFKIVLYTKNSFFIL